MNRVKITGSETTAPAPGTIHQPTTRSMALSRADWDVLREAAETLPLSPRGRDALRDAAERGAWR